MGYGRGGPGEGVTITLYNYVAFIIIQGWKTNSSDCPGQAVNFALRQAKIEVQWPGKHAKLASVVLLV